MSGKLSSETVQTTTAWVTETESKHAPQGCMEGTDWKAASLPSQAGQYHFWKPRKKQKTPRQTPTFTVCKLAPTYPHSTKSGCWSPVCKCSEGDRLLPPARPQEVWSSLFLHPTHGWHFPSKSVREGLRLHVPTSSTTLELTKEFKLSKYT